MKEIYYEQKGENPDFQFTSSQRFACRRVRKSVKEFASKLPGDKAALFLETVKRVHLNNQDAYNEIRESRKEAMKLLSAPEFDESAYRLQVEKIDNLRSLMKRRLADATIELARQFNQEERSALAQHLRRFSRQSRDSSQPSDTKTSP